MLTISRSTVVWHDPDEGLFYKVYGNRGPISWLREHLFRFKVEREYRSLSYLDEKGLPCSKPVLWSKAYDPSYCNRYELMVTRAVENSVSLQGWLKEDRTQEQKSAAMQALGLLVARMHEAAFYHGGLFVRNLLIDRDNPEQQYIIDVDTAIIYRKSIKGRLMAEIDLLCLCRDLRIHAEDDQLIVGFLDAYGYGEEKRNAFFKQLDRYEINRLTKDKNRGLSILMQLFY